MADKPNVLILHTDQQSAWTLSCYGGDGTHIPTPNLDRIATEGAQFNSFFTNCGVCTPSRGCFFTGRHTHCHGAWTNGAPLNEDEVTIAHIVGRNGYETGYAGKWHLDGRRRPGWMTPERSMGFEECKWMWNCSHPKSIVDNGEERPAFTPEVGKGPYTTDFLTDRAIEFIQQPRSNPFFYVLSYPDPHTPYRVREPYASMFPPDEVTVPETFSREDLPDWVTEIQERYADVFGNSLENPNREERLREQKSAYCGSVKCIDDNVGRLLDTLEEKGILNETVVIFTTDHGDYMGEHGLFGKNILFETAYRIPFLVRWPGTVPEGLVVDDFVTTVDFQPTMLNLLGLQPCDREQGRNAAPLFRGESVNGWEQAAYANKTSFNHVAIYTPDYWLGLVKEGGNLLFDRQNDPKETTNLFGDAEYETVVQELAGRLVQFHRRMETPAVNWLNAQWG